LEATQKTWIVYRDAVFAFYPEIQAGEKNQRLYVLRKENAAGEQSGKSITGFYRLFVSVQA
jgi:hypothetical protein